MRQRISPEQTSTDVCGLLEDFMVAEASLKPVMHCRQGSPISMLPSASHVLLLRLRIGTSGPVALIRASLRQ